MFCTAPFTIYSFRAFGLLVFGLYVASCKQNISSQSGDRFTAVTVRALSSISNAWHRRTLDKYLPSTMRAKIMGQLISSLGEAERARGLLAFQPSLSQAIRLVI